jgi:methionyl aminopeptidase
MIHIKNSTEIQIMKEGGHISATALAEVLKNLRPGVTLLELDKIAERTISSLGGTSSFKTVDDYRFTTCLNVNEGIVHGLPNKYVVKVGDLVSVDLGALYKGFHTDLSYTVEVGTNKESKFLDIGKKALEDGISKCVLDNRIGDVSYAIQRIVESAGYTVSRDLVGHGVGKELHEEPYVPGYGKPGKGIQLKEGMVLAVEVIYQKGRPEIELAQDGWTLKTVDNSLSGLFESTVAITKDGPLVLTQI